MGLSDIMAQRPARTVASVVEEDEEDLELEEDAAGDDEPQEDEAPSFQPRSIESTIIDTTVHARDGTNLEHRASYAARQLELERLAREASAARQAAREVSASREAPVRPSPRVLNRSAALPIRADPANAHEPSPARIFIRTLPRYLPQAMNNALSSLSQQLRCGYRKAQASLLSAGSRSLAFSIGVLILVSAVAMLANSDIAQGGAYQRLRNSFGTSEPWQTNPSDLEKQWFWYKHHKILSDKLPEHNLPDMQWAINVNMYQRIEDVEKRMDALADGAPLHDQTKALLHDILPSHLVIKEKDGSLKISDDLWHALGARLSEDTPENQKIWDAFVERNQLRLAALQDGTSSEAFLKELNDRHIVSRNVLIAELDKNYVAIQKQFNAKLTEVETRMLKEAKRIAEKTSTELIERSPAGRNARLQAGTLAYSNVLINAGNALKEPNFFSPGLGARVNPKLSSPTAQRPTGPLQYLYLKLAGIGAPNPPISALQGWQEATDCWCAAPTDKGQAQLAVEMDHKVYPERLVIEHIPHTATINIAAAPRNVEVWAETSSARQAKRMKQAIKESVPAAYWQQCNNEPSDRHVCIGRGQYDIHADNHYQAFEMFADARELGLKIDKAIVRVTTNWGAPWTCLYRVRLNGKRIAAHS